MSPDSLPIEPETSSEPPSSHAVWPGVVVGLLCLAQVALLFTPQGVLGRWLELLGGLGVVAVLGLLALGSGDWVLAQARRRLDAGSEGEALPVAARAVWAATLGLHVVTSALFVAAGVGLRGAWILLGLVAVAPLAVWGLRGLVDLPAVRLPASRRGQLAVGVATLVLAPVLLQALLPHTDWDTALSQLPLAQRFLAEGVWTIDRANAVTAYPGGPPLLYAALLALGALPGLLPLNLAVSFLLLAATWACARDLYGRRAGVWAAAVLATSNLLWELGLDGRVEGFQALAALCATHAMARWLREGGRRSDLAACGAFIGFGLGVKVTSLVVAGLLFLVGVGFVVKRRAWSAAGIAIALALLPAGAWYVRNAAVTGDPAYPKLQGYQVVGEAGRAPLTAAFDALALEEPPASFFPVAAAGRERGEAGKPEFANLLNWADVVDPYAVKARKPLHWVSPFLILLLFLPLIDRGRATALLLITGLGFYVVIALKSYLIRYAFPILPLWAVGAGAVLARPDARAWRWVMGYALGLLLLIGAVTEGLKLLKLRPAEYWSGREDALRWTRRHGYNGGRAVVIMVEKLNERVARGALGADEVIYMVGEGRGHALTMPYLPDSTAAAIRFQSDLVRAEGDLDRLHADLRARGVRWLLYAPGVFIVKAHEGGLRADPGRRKALFHFLRLVKRYGTVELKVGELTLIRLLPERRAG